MALLEAFAHPLDLTDPAFAHAELLNQRLAHWRARELLDEVIHHEFPERIALVSSFGAESIVLLHLVACVEPSLPVIFIDTGKIFGSTLRYRDETVERLGLTNVRVARPDPVVLTTQDTDSGLWLRNPDKCCAIRKVAPLARALSGFDAWISGRKRYQGGMRTRLPLAEADGDRIKINPLFDWSKEDMARYRQLHELPDHPLVSEGFRSIGCTPCTARAEEGEDERSGRWRGRAKIECGIHLGLAAFETDGSGI
jgi:phosphoadenosine phosphosulfate reductase